MTSCGDPKGRREIEKLFTFRVPHIVAPRLLPDDRPATLRVDERDIAGLETLKRIERALRGRELTTGGHGVKRRVRPAAK